MLVEKFSVSLKHYQHIQNWGSCSMLLSVTNPTIQSNKLSYINSQLMKSIPLDDVHSTQLLLRHKIISFSQRLFYFMSSQPCGTNATRTVHGCDLLVNAGVEPLVTHPDVSLRQLENIAKSNSDGLSSLLVGTPKLSFLQQQTLSITFNYHSTLNSLKILA